MNIERDLLAVARYGVGGVPSMGRDAERAALVAAGARDLASARIYEGHLNGLGLIARFGTSAQRAAARLDASAGRLYGVWNTQDADGLTVAMRDDRLELRGWKSWASGARTIARPVVTARLPDGRSQMLVVPLDEARIAIDSAPWEPMGMASSESVRVCFDGVTLRTDARLGEPGEYEREPWFSGGAIRFVAVQCGALERLVHETIAFLIERDRVDDAMQLARIGEMRVALETATLHVRRGFEAWKRFDDGASEVAAGDVVAAADRARLAVERVAVEILERSMKAVGARGLVEPYPFSRLVRDLQIYLRQPAPDAILRRVGMAACAAVRNARTTGSAISMGTGA